MPFWHLIIHRPIVYFRQFEYEGLNNREFQIYKFKQIYVSMRVFIKLLIVFEPGPGPEPGFPGPVAPNRVFLRKSGFSGFPGFRGFSPENPARVGAEEKNPDTGPGKVKSSNSTRDPAGTKNNFPDFGNRDGRFCPAKSICGIMHAGLRYFSK